MRASRLQFPLLDCVGAERRQITHRTRDTEWDGGEKKLKRNMYVKIDANERYKRRYIGMEWKWHMKNVNEMRYQPHLTQYLHFLFIYFSLVCSVRIFLNIIVFICSSHFTDPVSLPIVQCQVFHASMSPNGKTRLECYQWEMKCKYLKINGFNSLRYFEALLSQSFDQASVSVAHPF